MKRNGQEIKSAHRHFGPWDMLYFVTWFGVLAGLAEIVTLRTKGFITDGRVVYLRCHTMWMSPVANVMVLAIAGLVALPLLRRLSRPMAVRVAFTVLASMVFVNMLVIESVRLSRIHFGAKVILAVGLSVALQRLIARRVLGLERFVRRTTLGLVLLVVALTVAVGGWQRLKERRIIASLPDHRPAAPNVLLIVWDTVRADSMDLYGYERPTTPYLTDIAKEGAVFQNAIATSSWTLPTHASLFTGRFHRETLTSPSRPLDATYPTLAEVLTNKGYVTGGFVGNIFNCCVEDGIARGFAHYEDYSASAGELARSSSLIRYAFRNRQIRRLLGYHQPLGRKPASRITHDFLMWVDRVPNGHPFFAFLNYFDAHEPYLPPADFARTFGHTDHLDKYLFRYGHEPCLPTNTTAEEIESLYNAYDGCIAYLDYDLRRLFGELRQRGLLDRTLVILVSDHGEEFAEHTTLGHGRDLHIESIRVPLILRLPGIVPADVVVQEPVTLRDIPATVVDLLGIPDDGSFPGRSLGKYWSKSASQEPEDLNPVLSELSRTSWLVGTPVAKGDMESLITGDMHYIRNGDRTEEVYDLRHDPGEHDDLIETARGAKAAARARHIIETVAR